MLLQVLGDFTWRQGNYGEAEALHRRAIAIAEKAYGPQDPRVAARLFERPDADVPQNHPGHAAVLDELGKVYRALGRTAEAQEAEARAAILRTMR